MVAVHPNANFGGAGYFVVGAATPWQALDVSQSSYLSSFLNQQFSETIRFATPSGLTDDLRWVRGEVRLESRSNSTRSAGPVEVRLNQQPAFQALNITPPGVGAGGTPPGAWGDNPGASAPRFITGPRAMFLNGFWAVKGLPSGGGLFIETDTNNLRYEIHDYIDPPTVTITGPSGVTDIINGSYIPAQWSFSSPHGFAYVAWTLQVTTDVGGTQVIYQAAGATETTHQIPAYVLTPYLGQAVYVRVRAAQTVPGGYLAPDPTTGLSQYGAFSQVQFTPVGVVTATFGAVRPVDWVDDLSTFNRALLTNSHTPVLSAVLFTWDGQQSYPLDLLDGEVIIDSRQRIRSACRITVANPELLLQAVYPIDPARPLHPFGHYVQLARGVGDQQVALGAFVITSVSQDRTNSGDGPVDVEGLDWSLFVEDADVTWPVTRQTWTGSTWARSLVRDVIIEVVNEAGLQAAAAADPSAMLVAPNYLNERAAARFDILDDLTTGLGWWWYADSHGKIIAEPLPDPLAAARYNFVEGESCVVVSQRLQLTRNGMHDLVIAYDDSGFFVGGAYDANPNSPIRRGAINPASPTLGAGPFSPGGKPFFYASPFIVSLAGAQSAARTVLSRRAIPAERTMIGIVPKPDLRPGHVIELQRTGEPARRWVVDAVRIPLAVERAMFVEAYSPVTYVQATS